MKIQIIITAAVATLIGCITVQAQADTKEIVTVKQCLDAWEQNLYVRKPCYMNARGNKFSVTDDRSKCRFDGRCYRAPNVAFNASLTWNLKDTKYVRPCANSYSIEHGTAGLRVCNRPPYQCESDNFRKMGQCAK